MSEETVTVRVEVPADLTILTGYFLYDAIDADGERFHGAVEYQEYDGLKVIGMLDVARQELIARELDGLED